MSVLKINSVSKNFGSIPAISELSFTIVEWHAETQSFWFPYFFFDKPFQPDDLDRIPEFTYTPTDRPLNSSVIYFLVTITLYLLIMFVSARERWHGH